VAVFLFRRIGEGALDAPKPFRPRQSVEADYERLVDRPDYERYDEFACLLSPKPVNYERYLKMPFGEAVARICKGLGLTPDWESWAAEPWAQEEIRIRPPSSPYARYPAQPPPSPSWGGWTGRSPGRVGESAAPPPSAETPTSPPPRRSRGLDPPHEGEGGTSPPLNRKARRRLAALARKRARAAA
jgi:hypothetical protein